MTEEVEGTLRQALARADAGDEPGAWELLVGLVRRAPVERAAAWGLAAALGHAGLDRPRRVGFVRRLLARWPDDVAVLATLGQASVSRVEDRSPNAWLPSDPFFAELSQRLPDAWSGATGEERLFGARGLTALALVGGRRLDAVAEQAHAELLAADPSRWQSWYDRGLFLKVRGRFAEGAAANRRAAELGGADDDAVVWNEGICATGAGDGATALELWRRIGCTLELEDGLPTGTWEHVQVKLARRPAASRTVELDEPGAEETVWVERLSPCHGRICSALVQDLGVDWGDLVLFDGAPLATRTWGDRQVPVFPHLATLRSGGWRTFRFAATQPEAGRVAAAGERLGSGASLYVHTEQVRWLCRTCWDRDDQGHTHAPERRPIVTGKLVVPPDAKLPVVAAMLLRESAGPQAPKVFVPDLWRAVGNASRAETEQRRYDLLVQAAPDQA